MEQNKNYFIIISLTYKNNTTMATTAIDYPKNVHLPRKGENISYSIDGKYRHFVVTNIKYGIDSVGQLSEIKISAYED